MSTTISRPVPRGCVRNGFAASVLWRDAVSGVVDSQLAVSWWNNSSYGTYMVVRAATHIGYE
eukprot:6195150-Pleurochrysis_carterae.AAC.1